MAETMAEMMEEMMAEMMVEMTAEMTAEMTMGVETMATMEVEMTVRAATTGDLEEITAARTGTAARAMARQPLLPLGCFPSGPTGCKGWVRNNLEACNGWQQLVLWSELCFNGLLFGLDEPVQDAYLIPNENGVLGICLC